MKLKGYNKRCSDVYSTQMNIGNSVWSSFGSFY